MKTTLVAALALASLAVGGCADDGKLPRIRSFTASSQSVPEGGADVTFTWDVSRAKSVSLQPFPGLVTGSSATVSVTEPTTFTLVAKNGDGSDRKKLDIALGQPFTVTGRVLAFDRRPVPNTQVFVDEEILVTDQNGEFVVENVIPPYEVGVVTTEPGGPSFGGSALFVSLYTGVTRPDPVLLCAFCDFGVPTNTASVGGTITGGVGFPYPTPTPDPQHETNVTVSGPDFSDGTSASSATGDYALGLEWSGPATLPVSVATLQYRLFPEVTFTGYGRDTGSITNGMVADIDVALAPVATHHITGQIDAPFAVTSAFSEGFVDLGTPGFAPPGALMGVPIAFSERLTLPDAVLSTSLAFDLAVPEIPETTLGFVAGADGPDGQAFQVLLGLPASTTTLDVELPAISHLLTPVAGATVGAGTVFSVSPVEDAVYRFSYGNGPMFAGVPGTNVYLEVFSNSSTITFPDLGMLGSPADGLSFTWSVSAYTGFGSIDGIVADAQSPPSGVLGNSYAFEGRNFTYAPQSGVTRRTTH